MSTRGRHADEAFISPTTNEPFGAHATAERKAVGRKVHDFIVTE